VSSIATCKQKLPLPALWRVLFPAVDGPREDKVAQQMVEAPWRGERSASVAVRCDSGIWKWYDHGEKKGGDEVHLIEAARLCDKAGAIRVYHELAGVESEGKKSSGKKGGWMEDSRMVATYEYRDVEGRLLAEKQRWEPGADGQGKTFIWRRPAAEGMSVGTKVAKKDRAGRWWVWTREGVKPTLYRWQEWAAVPAEVVWICEGEKDADALRAKGVLSTSAPDGAGKWLPAFTDALAGRAVIICGDDDAPGRAHVAMVGAELREAGCKVDAVLWRRLGEANGKRDAAAWLAGVGDTQDQP
jgi:5S rRNA maturation endonuclease (ribonuclease M5)